MAHISIITYTGNDKTGVEMCQLKIPVTRARIRRLCPSVYLIIFFVNEITTTYGLIKPYIQVVNRSKKFGRVRAGEWCHWAGEWCALSWWTQWHHWHGSLIVMTCHSVYIVGKQSQRRKAIFRNVIFIFLISLIIVLLRTILGYHALLLLFRWFAVRVTFFQPLLCIAKQMFQLFNHKMISSIRVLL